MPPASSTVAATTGSAKALWLSVGLFVLTALVFLPAVANDFVNYDDPDYVTENEYVQAGLTREGVRWAMRSGAAANWHPLTWMSHMMDVSLFGKKPAGHHLTSILLHAANAVLAFWAFRRLTGALWASAAIAVLFALHPQRVESVAWVAERKDLLCASFFFLCLGAYATYVAEREWSRRKTVAYGGLLLSFALGLMAKPMLVTVPFVLLLLDFWPLRRLPFAQRGATSSVVGVVLEKLPLFALVCASCVITYKVQKAGGAVTEVLSLGDRLANALVSVPRYLADAFWPAKLAVLYPHPGAWPTLTVAAAAALVLGVTALGWWQRRSRPWLLVGWLWFVGMLVPVAGIVQVGLQSMADRYTYLPMLGVTCALVWTGRDLWGAPANRAGARSVAILLAMVMIAFSCVTVRQIRHWQNSLTLFDHTIAVAGERNSLAYNNRGHFQFEQGNYDAAIADYKQALAINPNAPEANNNYGEALARQGRGAEAVAYYEKALRAQPDLPQAHNNLANALADLGQLETAFKHYQIALSRRPRDANMLNNYGASLAMTGRLDEGQALIERALTISPDYASAHANLGNVLAIRGRREEALVHYDRALTAEPTDARTHFNRATLLNEMGRPADAIASYQRALQLSPVNPDAHAALGLALARVGRRDEAVRELQTALQQRPDHAQARAWLQAVEASQPR